MARPKRNNGPRAATERTNGNLAVDYRPLDRLIPYARNARTHTDEQIAQIAASIREFGFTNPILLDGDNGIVAGHGRLLAARKLGMAEAPCIELAHLTATQRKAYILADNKLALNAGWDTSILSLELTELKELGADLKIIGFTDEELAEIMQPDGTAGLTDPDEAPPVPEAPVTVAGDLWILGAHRLLCGDAKDVDHYARLVGGQSCDLLTTDPPYGVSYADKNKFLNAISRGNRIQVPIKGDHKKPEEMTEFWNECFTAAGTALKAGASYYVTGPQGGDLLLLLQSLRQSGFPLRHMLIWAKNNHVLGRCDYHYRHEPIIYGWREGSHKFYGGHSQTSLWEINKNHKSDLHPTQKPVELYVRAINNSSKSGDLVLDPFGGSGTAIIAAEQTQRFVRSLEIDEHYVDVAVERWQNFTGKDAILEGDGRTFNEIKAERLGPVPVLPTQNPDPVLRSSEGRV
jgi:DNA modification methylase